ncbi:hypothetical protein HKBW3C_02295, partial [Candidatus Hakubella thermalkaliphila]
MAARQAIG